MAVELNSAGESHARGLIASGKIDRGSGWSMSADDENAILGNDDWAAYGSWHLGVDRSAAANTKARYKYPFGKGGKVYRSALTAIRQRAGQQGASAIFAAAGRLLTQADKGQKSASQDDDAPSRIVCRFECKFTDGNAGAPAGSFEGYGSVFNVKDDTGDVVMPGAFKSTLAGYKQSGRMPAMLLNHGGMGGFFSSPSATDLVPVGKWTSMDEDTYGLQCKGQLIGLDTERGKMVYGAMKADALQGLSIGFQAKDFTRGVNANEPRRTLKEVHLLETSLVTFPANAAAQVSSVKSTLLGDVIDLKAAEDLLREALGLSRSEASRAIADIARIRRFGQGEPGPDSETRQAIAALRGRVSLLTG